MGHVSFTYVDAEGNTINLLPANTTFTGAIITDKVGADWTRNLYLDDAEGLKGFYCCVNEGATYSFTYDPTTNTVTII